MLVPVLPPSAPFNTAQRAWLNGFLAGMFGQIGDTQTTVSSIDTTPTSVQSGEALLAGPVAEHPAGDEPMPWHDPALPMAERLQLAEGKPPARVLMAAMAQLDCGACGYLCQSYSEAIVAGAEKSLSLCAPGGKETSKKLKELLAVLPK